MKSHAENVIRVFIFHILPEVMRGYINLAAPRHAFYVLFLVFWPEEHDCCVEMRMKTSECKYKCVFRVCLAEDVTRYFNEIPKSSHNTVK